MLDFGKYFFRYFLFVEILVSATSKVLSVTLTGIQSKSAIFRKIKTTKWGHIVIKSIYPTDQYENSFPTKWLIIPSVGKVSRLFILLSIFVYFCEIVMLLKLFLPYESVIYEPQWDRNFHSTWHYKFPMEWKEDHSQNSKSTDRQDGKDKAGQSEKKEKLPTTNRPATNNQKRPFPFSTIGT